MASEIEDHPPQKRSRSRIIQACIPCHRSKRKCNRKKPCSQCLKRQTTKNCTYEALAAEDLEILEDDTTSVDAENRILRSRITQLEAVIMQLRDRNTDPVNSRKRRRTPEKAHDQDGVYYGRSFYLGGAAAPDLLHQMMALHPNQPSDLLFAFFGGTDSSISSRNEGGSILPIGNVTDCGVGDICACLRSIARESLDAILDSFVEIVDPLHHYLPMPWILQRYERCMNIAVAPEPQEAALVFAVLGLGNLVAANRTSFNFISASFQLLRLSNFLTSPSIDTMATFCFIAVYQQHEGKLNEYWPLLGMVIRLAQSMGLHRDPSLISSLVPEESEIRRRLFHAIVGQETALSVMFGRPNGLGFFDCALPRDMSDAELFGVNSAVTVHPHEISYNRYAWELMEITRDLVTNSFTTPKSSTLAREKSISQQLRQWYQNLPPSFRFQLPGLSLQDLNDQEEKCLLRKDIKDTSSVLRIGPSTNQELNSDENSNSPQAPSAGQETEAADQLFPEVNGQLSPTQAVSTDSPDTYNVDGVDHEYNDLLLDCGQAFDSYMTQVAVPGEALGMQPLTDSAQYNIFDLDVANWPFWLTADQASIVPGE
ncbi:hypothetical protein N7522_013511 [Penicillium canescens]|nr:hypothetical protein N7522_013511 [Penicillium canescens]